MKLPSPTVLRTFRRRLTNLSSRNRSLVLTSLPVAQFLDLHEADFLLNKPSFSVIADLIARRSVAVCEVLDARQERSNEVSRKLRRIDRTARFIEEERGTEDLYVGWPFVKGKFLDETVVHGPLLFFPVKIEHQGKYWKLIHRGDELAFLNPTLALAYGQFNQVKIPDELVEKTFDDFDRDSLVFRTQLYEWLKNTPFELNFNQDIFTDALRFFNKQSAKDLAQLERTGELKLYPEAVLGIFPQAGSFLVPDYDALIFREEGKKGRGGEEGPAVEDSFVTSTPSPVPPFSLSSTPSFLPEKLIHTPLAMDASQEAAVRAVKAGQSLVVQGPPGTGKSQLIANLMADAAASGKRVLLVCQKRAALDVVQARLEQVGMAPFLALIHDFQDDRRALYAQVAEQINRVDAYRQQNNGLNAVLIERDFDVESRRIDETVAELDAFKTALFDTSIAGVSAKELYLTSNSRSTELTVDDLYQNFRLSEIDGFVQQLAELAAYAQRLPSTHPWAERVNFANFTYAELTKIAGTIRDWVTVRNQSNEQTSSAIGQPLSLNDLISWVEHDWEITALLTTLGTSDRAKSWPVINQLHTQPSHPVLTVDENKLDQLLQAWEESLAVPGPESSLSTPDLRPFRTVLVDALQARPSWLTWHWWQLTNVGKAQLQQVADANKLSLSEPDLRLLLTKVDQRIRLEAIRFEAGPLLQASLLAETPANLRLLQQARQLVERIQHIGPLRALPEFVWRTGDDFINSIQTILAAAQKTVEQRDHSSIYLTENQRVKLWKNETYVGSLHTSLQQDFDLLVEADRLRMQLTNDEKAVTERLDVISPTQWQTTFLAAIRQAWLMQIETAYPVLRTVSSLRMEQWEHALQESVARKQMLSRDILLMKLREQTYRNLTFNRLNNLVTYRDLLHQTTKKRNVWPIRKLMESFAEEVLKLVPCWLASPESVSAILPLRDDLFDLVIFDEASQCFAESGIPAMARGRQVVVTGDSQQLRPSDLYRTRLDETETEEDIPVELEVESLLELAAHQLPQLALTEHYRSYSLDLISFSNANFYQNKLALLPHFDTVNQRVPAIRYLNVKGMWQQNTNPTEAEAVIDLIDELRTELPGRSIGVVTFNYPQQQLIQDRLERRVEADPTVQSEQPPSALPLFVKNIENVQGDERDVIIFSVGYAPDERGRLSMQFGSLNARGGGNRLNVAVTRARERVYVVTSLWPDQLNVDGVANEGPRLLKAYLTYALTVAQEQFKPRPAAEHELPSTALLKNKLTTQHPHWRPELPFADLTIVENKRYTGLILTDDDQFYQQTTKQAHAYLPTALAQRAWPFQRQWSREFWRTNATDT